MSPFWDILGKAANLFQVIGLDAVTFITVTMSFLWVHEVNKGCRKLEDCVQMLQLLQCSPGGCWIMHQQQQQHMELKDLVTNALKDAEHLFVSYKESTLFSRVRRGRSMARQFRHLRGRIDSYCCLILSINAYLLMVEANAPPPSLFRTEVNNGDGGVPPATGHSIDPADATSMVSPDDTHIINVSQE